MKKLVLMSFLVLVAVMTNAQKMENRQLKNGPYSENRVHSNHNNDVAKCHKKKGKKMWKKNRLRRMNRHQGPNSQMVPRGPRNLRGQNRG